MHRVVTSIRGDGVVGCAIDIERFAWRIARVGAEPILLEIIAGFGRRPLLVESLVCGKKTGLRAGKSTTFPNCAPAAPHRPDRILGAHLVGPHAEEVINLFAVAIRHGLTTKDLNATMFDYPTDASDIGYTL